MLDLQGCHQGPFYRYQAQTPSSHQKKPWDTLQERSPNPSRAFALWPISSSSLGLLGRHVQGTTGNVTGSVQSMVQIGVLGHSPICCDQPGRAANPGIWKHGLKSAVPRWFNFDLREFSPRNCHRPASNLVGGLGLGAGPTVLKFLLPICICN